MRRLKTLGFLMQALWLTLLLAPASSAQNSVVSGRGIGKVKLGATRQSVHKLLGKPKWIEKRKDGLIEDWWEFRKPKRAEGEPPYGINITFGANKAIQIWVNSPQFSTSTGVSTRSTPAQIRQKFKNIQRVATYVMQGDFDGPVHVYDDLQRGIGFEIYIEEGKQFSSGDCTAIVVHSPSHPIIPGMNDIVKKD